jgi:hypothetical protein
MNHWFRKEIKKRAEHHYIFNKKLSELQGTEAIPGKRKGTIHRGRYGYPGGIDRIEDERRIHDGCAGAANRQ